MPELARQAYNRSLGLRMDSFRIPVRLEAVSLGRRIPSDSRGRLDVPRVAYRLKAVVLRLDGKDAPKVILGALEGFVVEVLSVPPKPPTEGVTPISVNALSLARW